VSNHANSFMDPMLIGLANWPIVHFMVRSDVFKWWLKPVYWAAHMLPIYRQQDGVDTKEKNQDSFDIVNRHLSKGRNILIFGEGFTDDTPIRGLKPIKKGAVRMGFAALEATNWEKNFYICALGVNYTDRNTIGSEFVLVNGDKICLNNYKEAYELHPNKVINEVMKRLESEMQACLVYVKDPANYTFLEQVMQITRKGMNHENHDPAIPLKKRWEYARQLALWINEHPVEEQPELASLKKDLEGYFNLLKRMKLQDRFVLAQTQPALKNRTKEALILVTLWPFALVGLLHGLLPYLAVKKFVEKTFRRKVFWGSVKMMLGKLVGTIYNIPIVILVTHYFFPYQWMGIVYFLLIPFTCWIAWHYMKALKEFQLKGAMNKVDVSKFTERRADLVKRIETGIPVA